MRPPKPRGPLSEWLVARLAGTGMATIPLLIHNTAAILNNWGSEGWELVQVVQGPEGGLVAYLKALAAGPMGLVGAHPVGGDRVEVTAHVKPGVDPHEFEPKPADLQRVAKAYFLEDQSTTGWFIPVPPEAAGAAK